MAGCFNGGHGDHLPVAELKKKTCTQHIPLPVIGQGVELWKTLQSVIAYPSSCTLYIRTSFDHVMESMSTTSMDVQYYTAGLHYENLLKRLNKPQSEIRARCAGEMQSLLAIESGRMERLRGTPTIPKWRESIKKKVLKAFDKLLERKRMVPADRVTALRLREVVLQADNAAEISGAIEGIWPIVNRVLPNGK